MIFITQLKVSQKVRGHIVHIVHSMNAMNQVNYQKIKK